MDESNIELVAASGEEIEQVVSLLEPVLVGIPRVHAFIALLSMAIVTMKPDVSDEQLHDSLEEISEYMCMILSEESITVSVNDKPQMN